MAFLDVKGIRKSFPGVVALDGVDLEIELGAVHVLAGENGAGKSTLIRALTGLLPLDGGSIRIDGRDALADRSAFDLVAYVPQELSLFPHMSVAENLFMPFAKAGFGGRVLPYAEMNREARAILERFSIKARPEQKVKSIAVSDQQLLQIARATTNKRLKVLILDEPTSSLTTQEIDRLFRLLRQFRDNGTAIVFVSHKMEEIFELGTTVTVLRNGKTVGHRPMAAVSEPELIRMMSGDEVQLDQVFQPACAPGETIVTVDGLCGQGFHDISFALRRGEILGFAGLVGAGRSEVMQSMFGFKKPTAGTVMLKGRPLKLGKPSAAVEAGMLYLSEERRLHGILPVLSLRENIGISVLDQTSRGGVISTARERGVVGEVIASYDIKASSPEKKIMFLSGGNQQKAIIGRAMARKPDVLIFDEPTRGIDIRNKVEIYKIMKRLAEDGVAIILVSSEMAELKRCASRIITMYSGKLSGEFATATTDTHTLVGAIIGSAQSGQPPAGAPSPVADLETGARCHVL
ncbi:sugar ABC transporter ATP-binding protein [Rhodospirillum rubrum]|uniref:sugar ABC transporter ATP-binding protein n=1 Tax=Rhodospirillum rubrum TaxID=1085 RepID=UPI0019049D01|nr:sugar ABC transporter ATP-binding protein [Rhodospirillum rubrum]MBK1662946.1 sugar ABC transporter ATP-binding protein [Rhodospirillum rubrum]MBK1675233.1 sugar ABC transporter ATP-binding protein [Rhodospirillum rubrum]